MIIKFLIMSLRNMTRLRNKEILLPRILGNYLFVFLRISGNLSLPVEM